MAKRPRVSLKHRRRRIQRWLSGILIYLMVMLFILVQFRGPTPVSLEPKFEDRVSGLRAMDELKHLLELRPESHPAGTVENKMVRDRLVARLRDFDVEVMESKFTSEFGELVNVIGRRPGKSTYRPLLITTHYDSTPFGPGAGDDLSGVAAVLEMLRCLHQRGGGPELWLLISDGEERGLLGAQAFVQQSLPWGDAKPLVLNLDSRGTEGSSLLYETHRDNYALMQQLRSALAKPSYTNSLMVSIYERMPYATDFTIFKKVGWPGWNFALVDGSHRYHTPNDVPEQVSEASLQHLTNQCLKWVDALQSWTTAEWTRIEASQPAVFFDLLGGPVIVYPEYLNALWTVLSWVGFLVLGFRIHANNPIRYKVILKLIVAMLAMLIFGYLIGKGTTWLLKTTEVVERPFVEWGSYIALVHSINVMAMLVTFGGFVFGTSHVHHARMAILFVLNFMGTMAVLILPGSSFLFHWPAIWMTMLYCSVGNRREVDYVSCLLSAILFGPLCVLGPIALGPMMGELIGAGTVFVFLPTLVLLSDMPMFTNEEVHP